MSDNHVAVAREALQAIIKRHLPYNPNLKAEHTRRADLDLADVTRALVALEAAEAALAERDEKIREHAEVASALGDGMCAERMEAGYPDSQCEGCDVVKAMEAILALLAPVPSTEEES